MNIFPSGQIPGSINVGGMLLSPGGLIIYQAELEGSATQASSLYRCTSNTTPGQTAVTSGKTLYVQAIRYYVGVTISSGGIPFYHAYGDSFVTNASPPANIKGIITQVTPTKADILMGGYIAGGQVNVFEAGSVFGTVPQNKFPCVQAVAGTGPFMVQWFCYEA